MLVVEMYKGSIFYSISKKMCTFAGYFYTRIKTLYMKKKTVFLTGATGTMGWAAVNEFLKHEDRFHLKVLVRSSDKDKKKLSPIDGRIEIVWGDLCNYEDVLRGVDGADYVLHVGGMVSPSADYYPNTTRKVNVLAAENIVKAVKAQPKPDEVKVCYIGTVAQTSDRNEPIHWGRTGDPICISVYDHYAISKTNAEKVFVDSGLKYWVSMRQTGILYAGILKNYDPIMFHVPLRGVLEWATVEDSGRLLLNVCEDWVREDFWCNFYNISSGDSYRLTNYEFECMLLKTISCPMPEKMFNPEWFVLRNFHGQWYSDSDKLEEHLKFRDNIPAEDYFKNVLGKKVKWFFHLSKIVPPFILRMSMRPMAYKKKWGTQWWIKNNDEWRIAAFYGSKERWEAIPRRWEDIDLSAPTKEVNYLNHGYDENKPRAEWTIEDMKKAAEWRGGKCVSETMEVGNFSTQLEWECQFGHRFKASPTLVLLGGHWCPECLPSPWNYNEIAKGNPFFAQVWYPLHSKDETDFYPEEIFDGWE